MKITLLHTNDSPFSRAGFAARNLALAGIAACAVAVPQAIADDEYEWDPAWGMHEEEWYDPSDWFNEDSQISYEDYGHDDPYYTDSYWNSYDYYGDYGYDCTGYEPVNTGYDSYYQWSPDDENWSEVSGDKSESDMRKTEAEKTSKDSKKDIDKKDVLTMRGTIQSVGKAKTKGSSMDHTFVVLEADSGKSVLVDFGSKADLDKVKLEKDNTIQVRGPRAKFGGRYVLVAQQVSAVKSDSDSDSDSDT